MGKKKANLNKLSLEELERYIQQLKEPLVVNPVKKNKGGGLNAAIDRVKRVQGMEEGGEVPKKFKGFSKLPEAVQQKMDPVAASKYEDGGEVVRGMGRAYRAAPRKAKIR